MMRNRARTWAAWLGLACMLAQAAWEPARAQEVQQLPVPAVTIYPNEVISDERLTERSFIAHTVTRGSVHDARQGLVGKVARRTLLAGQPIPTNAIREPFAVQNGKTALVVFESGGLTITSTATALQDGSIGELVSLRNNDSGLTIKGTIAPDGTVRVGMP